MRNPGEESAHSLVYLLQAHFLKSSKLSLSLNHYEFAESCPTFKPQLVFSPMFTIQFDRRDQI